MYYIETERLKLRQWREGDKEPFARMNADPVIMEFMPRILPPKDSDKLADKFAKQIKSKDYGFFAVETKDEGEFIGFAGLNDVPFEAHFTPAIEMAWRLDYGAWGKGYASEIADELKKYAFQDMMFEELVGFCVHDNEAARHVMEKVGMTYDADGDFDFPTLRKDHPLGQFVLYRMAKG